MNSVAKVISFSPLTESSPLLTKEKSQDTLFPEDSPNPYKPQAVYHDPEWMTVVQYQPYHPTPKVKEVFKNREGMLEDLVATRLENRVSGDYSDFANDGLWGKCKGLVTKHFSESVDYERHLQGQTTNLRHPNYSVKPVRDFNIQITPKQETRTELGLTDPKDDYKLWTKSTWAKNGPNGLAFTNEAGEMEVVHNAVTSSNDRTTEKIPMMRAIDDYQHTQESVAYTGRPDTRERAIEQIEFMFKREQAKGEKGQGLHQKDDVMEFTYMVNNLMTPIALIGLVTFDEKASIDREAAILEALSQETLVIDGQKVRIKPIYFNQGFNKGNYYAPSSPHNPKGYEVLFDLAEKADVNKQDQLLLDSAIHHLENPKNLLPEEELFYRVLISKICRIPIVMHCKSSTDRTMIALGVAVALHQWRNTSQPFPDDSEGQLSPHLVLQNPLFKELFTANAMGGHQVTRVSRTAEGVVKGMKQENRVLGLQWHGNPVALRMLPERYTKEAPNPGLLRSIGRLIPGVKSHIQPSFQPWFIGTLLSILKIVQFIFNINWVSQKINYIEKAFPNKQFDMESPHIKERSFLKPSGMTV